MHTKYNISEVVISDYVILEVLIAQNFLYMLVERYKYEFLKCL